MGEKDILKNYTIANYKALDFLESKATIAAEREKVQAARARLDAHLKILKNYYIRQEKFMKYREDINETLKSII